MLYQDDRVSTTEVYVTDEEKSKRWDRVNNGQFQEISRELIFYRSASFTSPMLHMYSVSAPAIVIQNPMRSRP